MNTKKDYSLDEIRGLMDVWSQTPQLGPAHLEAIAYLQVAATVSREHFDATALWLFDQQEELMKEAVAVARHFGVLRNAA